MRNLKNEESDYIEKIQYAVASIEDLATTMNTINFEDAKSRMAQQEVTTRKNYEKINTKKSTINNIPSTSIITTTTSTTILSITTTRRSNYMKNTIETEASKSLPNYNLPRMQNESSIENRTIVPLFQQKSQGNTRIFKRANSMYEKCESIYNERPKNWKSPKFCREDSGYRESFLIQNPSSRRAQVEKLT